MRIFYFALFMLFVSACSTLSPTGQAIRRSSQRVDRSLDNSYELLYDGPVEIQTRFNPCSCDSALEFEANIHGQWRHVMIRGSDAGMEALREKVRNLEMHQVFNVSYQLSDVLYTSTTGQDYYTLILAESE